MTRETLIRIRAVSGLSRAEFAKKGGYSTETVRSWEQGRRKILKRHEIALKKIFKKEFDMIQD